MSGVYTTNFRAEAPGWVEILVAEHELERAGAALDEIQEVRQVWQFFRDRRPETYGDLVKE